MFNKSIPYHKNFFFSVSSLKKNIIPFIFLLFLFALLIFSSSNLYAAKSGLKLWANNVIPALFPFFIATELLSYTNIPNIIGLLFQKFVKKIFNVPGCAAYAFIIGIISGYPIGAKVVTSFRNSGVCSRNEGNRMLCFTNNSSPLFIVGTIGISLFKSSLIGFLLLFTHIISSILVGFLFGFFSKVTNIEKDKSNSLFTNINNSKCNFSNLGEILSTSILNSIKTILLIGGFVVLFSVIISILNSSKLIFILSNAISMALPNINVSFINGIFTGLLELTNGLSIVSSIPSKLISNNIIACSFILGFGGFSVLLQVWSIISKSDLSIKPYFYGKLLQGTISAFLTYILINNVSFLNLNL